MNSEAILIIYLVLFGLHLAVEILLEITNIRFVRQNAGSIPEFFKDHLDFDTYAKSVPYTISKARFSLFSLVYSAGWLLMFILLGWFGELDALIASAGLDSSWRGVCYVLVLSLLFQIIGMPLSLYGTFIIEGRFGFNKTTWRIWIADRLKGLVISALIMIPLLLGLFWFMDKSGSNWWIYASCFIFFFQLMLLFVYPVWIAPLFNKFSPLPDGELKEKILELAKAVRFKTSGIFIMDGSRRSAHGNAYFTGFGKNKRVILYDTLVELLSEYQLLAVLAHEMGHQKRGHILKTTAISGVSIFIGFWVLASLMDYQAFYSAFGFDSQSYHAALVIFAFASEPLTYFLSPLFSVLSRRFEYQADSFAVDATGHYEGLKDALLALSKKNLSNLTPHPWYSFFHYSHPTLIERLQAMKEYYLRESCADRQTAACADLN